MRTKMLVAASLLLGACGADVEGACQAYIDSWVGCLEEGYADDVATLDTLKAATEGTCDAYQGITDKASADLLNCYADTIGAGDCSTPEAAGASISAIGTDCI